MPPIDPIVFAKIGIPAEEGKLVEASIGQLKDMPNFGEDFANDRCPWWPSKIENPIISKKAFNGDYYIEAYLIQENDGLILYLKYFTV